MSCHSFHIFTFFSGTETETECEMSPASSSSSTAAAATAAAATTAGTSSCLVVAWDLDTTGRRLIDEICQIGAYAVLPSPNAQHGGGDNDSDSSHEKSLVFSQYVMPYRNPNPGARRSFGIKVILMSFPLI